jgi:dynamin 1-like protein
VSTFSFGRSLTPDLLEKLYRPDLLSEILKESEEVVARRKECVR